MNVKFFTALGVAALLGSLMHPIVQPTVTVRGVVYDSLAMKPVVGASVWISGGNQITRSDSAGRFELTRVAAGKRFLEFSSNALDSLQLGTLGTWLEIGTTDASISLATPSFASLRRALCKGESVSQTDSGIIWGTIRDAATETRQHGAKVTFVWTELQVDQKKQVGRVDRNRDVFSDSAGNYYACGLPVASTVFVQATGSGSTSGLLTHSIGEQQLSRLDVLVSTEMVTVAVASDRTTGLGSTMVTPRGTATARIVVRDEKQRALGQSAVTISALDSVLMTDADGALTVSNLPAGTHVVTARKIGIAPISGVLQLRPGVVTELNLVASRVTELAAVDVKGETFRSRDRLDFEDRRRVGFGYQIDSKTLENKHDLASVLGGMPSMTLKRTRFGTLELLAPPTSLGTPCRPKVWIDGVPGTMDDVSTMALTNFRAIEWFPRATTAPAKYVGFQSCSIILFWTTSARWGR